MANVVHRTTKELRQSVNTPDFNPAQWIINPDLSAVVGVPNQYWIISGDTITEMSQAQKDQLDADNLTASRDNVADQVDEIEDIIRALALTILDELNIHAGKINAILDASDTAANLASFKAGMAAITDHPQRTIAQLKTTIRNKLGS